MTLALHLKKVEQTCQTYLADKTSKRTTDTGKDRFAGALGILEMLNFEEAEKIRQKASAVQKKQIRFDELADRAHQQAEKRERKHAAKQRQADRSNSRQS